MARLLKQMIEELILEKVAHELQHKTWGVTEQFLNVHEINLVDGKPKIDRIDFENSDGSVSAYVSVTNEAFHLAIHFDNKENLVINGISTEPYSSVYFRATSESIIFPELAAMTTIKATRGWSKGDLRRFGKGRYKFSALHIEPNPEPDDFEDKLLKLLDVLEQDKEGVTKLINDCSGYVQIAMRFHNGNTALGGIHLDQKTLGRLNALGLAIDFDLYAEGEFFKDR